jgi:hypothetical protein
MRVQVLLLLHRRSVGPESGRGRTRVGMFEMWRNGQRSEEGECGRRSKRGSP